MSDSQKLIIRLPEVLPEHGFILFPAKHLLIIDEKCALTLKSVEGDICGLTTAKNKVTAKLILNACFIPVTIIWCTAWIRFLKWVRYFHLIHKYQY